MARDIANGDVALWDYITNQINDSETWDDVKWLRGITKLPIVAKGILTGMTGVKL